METAFQKETYECMAPVFSGSAGRETGEECVVPDTMPDVGAVVDAEGILSVRGKETEEGAVRLSASVSVTVVYTPEGGGAPRCMELTLPADIRVEAEGVDETCMTAATMRVRGIDARAVNSRKLSVRAEVEAQVRCWRRTSVQIACGLAEENGQAHILARTTELMPVTDVREKTFVVTDEYQMPAGADMSLLSRRVETAVEDVKYVSGKAVFRGRVRSELLFSSSETEQLSEVRFETEFSQIMEVGTDSADARPEITLLLTGAYFDMPEYGDSSGRLSAEIHMAAQCVCREKRTVTYIADIYSNRTELVPQTEAMRLVTDVRPISMRQTVAGQAEAFSGGEIIRASASAGGVTTEDGSVKTTVNVRLLYRKDDGSYAAARCRLPAEFTLAEPLQNARLADIAVTVTDAYATAGAGGADVRAALQMDAAVVTETVMEPVCAAVSDDEAWQARERTPSVTLARVPAGTDMWQIARRYRSTVDAIAAANDGRQEGLLLIPKGR